MITKIQQDGWAILIDSDITLSPEQIECAKKLMAVAKPFAAAMNELTAILPDSHQHQFFGNWDLLRIKKYNEAHEIHDMSDGH